MALPLRSSRSLLIPILMAVICISQVAVATADLPPTNDKTNQHPQPEPKAVGSPVIPVLDCWYCRKYVMPCCSQKQQSLPHPIHPASLPHSPWGEDSSLIVHQKAEPKPKPLPKPMPKPEPKPMPKPKPEPEPKPKPMPKPMPTLPPGAPH